MSKYQAYPEYQDSGIEWLGKIPANWGLPKLKNKTTRIGDGLHSTPIYTEMTGFYFINGNNLINGKIKSDSSTKEVSEAEYKKHYIHMDQQTILLSINGTIGNVALYNNEKVILGKSAAYINCALSLQPNFFIYYLQSAQIQRYFDLEITGTTISNLSLNSIRQLRLCLPSQKEQTQIAAFLDHETAKIDTLIEKQQQLIELLKEKRQAVISHAVTKGLNPQAPMKDSGVEWLGEVPEHWDVLQFRRISSLSQGLQIPQSERFYEPLKNCIEYITIKSINAGNSSEHKEYIHNPSDRVICGRDDVLLARTGATGEVVTNVTGAFHNNFFKVKYSSAILKYFLVNLLSVKELKSHLLMLAGTTTIPDLNHGAFLNTKVPLPPLNEQSRIINEINAKNKKFNQLLDVAKKQISLLNERRTALISAAVTGKIDVRNWVAPTTSSEINEAVQEVTV